MEGYNPADKVSDFDFDPLESEVFNINDVTRYFPSPDNSVQIIDISSYPETPDTIDIEIVDNDDISFTPSSLGNTYTSYSNPSTSYSYSSNPTPPVGEYSYIPEPDLLDSLSSPSTVDSVFTAPLGKLQPLKQTSPKSGDQNTFLEELRKHTSSLSGKIVKVEI